MNFLSGRFRARSIPRWLPALACVCVLVGSAAPAVAEDAGGAEETKPLRVLVLYGGHGFHEARFFGMVDGLPGVKADRLDLRKQPEKVGPELAEKYDALLLYDMIKGLKPEHHEAYVELLNKGIGVVALHHTIGARPEWPKAAEVLGGKWIPKPETIDGRQYSKSPWRDDVHLSIRVADPDHPITRGIEDFELVDELYGPYYVSPKVHVLLECDTPGANPQVAWTHQYGNSRIFYLSLGHDNKAWSKPVYQKLVLRGLQWVTEEASESR